MIGNGANHATLVIDGGRPDFEEYIHYTDTTSTYSFVQ